MIADAEIKSDNLEGAKALIQQVTHHIIEVVEGGFVLGTVIDIGAHVGIFTVAALRLGAKHVVAVEPAPENLQFFYPFIESHTDWDHRVTIVPCAVARNHDEVRILRQAGSNSGQYSIAFKETYPGIEVKTYAFKRLLQEHVHGAGCYLKIDIEGAEWEILDTDDKGLAELFCSIEYFEIEIHSLSRAHEEYFAVRGDWFGIDESVYDGGEKLERVVQFLQRCGFDVTYTNNPPKIFGRNQRLRIRS